MKQKTPAEAARETISRLLADERVAPDVLAMQIIHASGVKLALGIAFSIVKAVAAIQAMDGKPLPPETAPIVDKARKIVAQFESLNLIVNPLQS